MVLAMLPFWSQILVASAGSDIHFYSYGRQSTVYIDPLIPIQILLAILVALTGVWTAHRSAQYWNTKDPQKVVIDEVSGQQLALLLGGFWPWNPAPSSVLSADHIFMWSSHPLGLSMMISPNWKYLLLGFILFRVFDIWKPFPARQAESLPGGLGIMADDWIAGIYAALALWLARSFGFCPPSQINNRAGCPTLDFQGGSCTFLNFPKIIRASPNVP